MVTPYSEWSIRSGMTTSQVLKRMEAQKREAEALESKRQQLPSQRVSEISTKQFDVELPDVPTQTETYDPRIGMYISTSPRDQFGTSVVTRSPSIEERKRIEEAEYKGSFGGIIDVAERKVVTPVLESKPVKKVTTTIRDLPLIDFSVGEKVGDVIRDPTLLKDYFRTSKPDVVLDLDKGVARLPTEEDFTKTRYKRDRDVLTVGEAALGVKEATTRAGEISELGWLDISGRFYEKAKTKEGIQKNILTSAGEISGLFSQAVTVAPSVIQYTALTPMGGASLDLLAIEEKKAQADKYVKEELGKQYNIYKGEYQKSKGELEEGYELEPMLSRTDFQEQYGKEIREDVERGIRQESVMPFIILGTAGAVKLGKGVKWGLTPREVVGTRVGGKTMQLEPVIKGQQIFTDKGVREFVTFKQLGIRTPVSAYYQSPFSKLLNLEPKLRVLAKGQTYVSTPIPNLAGIPIETGKPYWLVKGRVGKSGDLVSQRIFQIDPKSGSIVPEEIIQLPKQEQYIWKGLVEKTKTGVPIRYEDISKYIPEEQLLQMGKVSRIDFSKLGTGRATSTIRADTIVTPIKRFDSGAGTFRIETGIKDISKPYWRASGKVDVSKAIYLRYPPLDVSTRGSGVDSFIGGGKKSSAQFLKQLYETPKPVIIPDVKIPKVSAPVLDITKGTRDIITTPTVSVWAGTGLYERTTGESSAILETRGQIISPISVDGITEQSKVETGLVVSPKTRQRERLETRPLLRLSEQSRLLPRELTRLQEKQVSKQQTKQLSKQVSRQLFQPMQITKTTQTQATPQKPITQIPIIPLPKIPSKLSKKEKKGLLDEDEFEVFVKKRGEDISIGEFTTLPEARRKLKSELTGTLRASGFISKAGEKLSFGDVGIVSSEFKPAKRDSFRIVQRRERRIKTGGEIGEILKTRKSGGFFK